VMTRVNISIPEALHEAMQDRPEKNWSAIAAEAFRSALSGHSTIETVLELRLQLEKAKAKLAQIHTLTKD
jgi:hypothetical protein